eukprot:352338-Chlamydomonas_euryale.AAC.14
MSLRRRGSESRQVVDRRLEVRVLRVDHELDVLLDRALHDRLQPRDHRVQQLDLLVIQAHAVKVAQPVVVDVGLAVRLVDRLCDTWQEAQPQPVAPLLVRHLAVLVGVKVRKRALALLVRLVREHRVVRAQELVLVDVAVAVGVDVPEHLLHETDRVGAALQQRGVAQRSHLQHAATCGCASRWARKKGA